MSLNVRKIIMKNINVYIANKYADEKYRCIGGGIYKHDNSFVISLSFFQEPEFQEGVDSSDISQYPLEDILDKYCCYISDFYEELNKSGLNTSYLEFASSDVNDLNNLREIVGKHVYNKDVEKDGQVFTELIIE